MEDFPEPDTPVKIVILRFGMRNDTFFRLFSRAPRISMYSWGIIHSWWQAQSSTRRLLHERADPRLFGGGQLLQREGGRPHGAFVEVRRVAEAERRVPVFELVRALEEADDLAIPGICGHPVPGLRREGRRAGFDDLMESLGH